MLLELAVNDLALLERVRLPLGPGLTVLTGETGAGKSLLIDALLLVSGGRADGTLLRAGAASARIEALFDRLPEPLIAVRELTAGGRSIARLDDETVTVGRLAATVGPLVEIHGQHEQQRLLAGPVQRDLLDAYAGLGDLRAACAEAVARWRAASDQLDALPDDPAVVARRLELARWAVDEIDAIAPLPGETERLRERLAAAAAGDRVQARLDEAADRLTADGRGARDLLGAVVAALADAARHDPSIETLATRAAGLEAESEDLALELRRVAAEAERDRDGSAALEARLSALYDLQRKYGGTEDAVIAHAERARAELDELASLAATRARLGAEAMAMRAEAAAIAERLAAGRRAAAARLAPAVGEALARLGFRDGAFDIAFATVELAEHGVDEVEFLLAPNPGEPPRPLTRIASGGELSRVSLALKRVLAGADATPTLVFDEVDAGIGGRSADPVGRMLHELGRSHQVLCVTHLPQIAAYADAHVRIAKTVRDGRTATGLHLLGDEERVTELATMLAGGAVDEAAAETARRLVAHARAGAGA